MTKKELRQKIRVAKSQQDSAALVMWSNEICEKLIRIIDSKLASVSTLQITNSKFSVIAYYPLPDEVDVRPVIDYLYNKGVQVLLPKVTDDTMMEIRLYEGPESLKKGYFGIMEPTGPIVNCSPLTSHCSPLISQCSLSIIPGMAFDRVGHRLGRGKGYYDRFLLNLSPKPYKIGVCYPFQIVDDVPSDEHDVLMDDVIFN